jgi:hypothetical protein
MSYQDYIDQLNQELLDDLSGRGPGDPDMYGYPGEPRTIKSATLKEISLMPDGAHLELGLEDEVYEEN